MLQPASLAIVTMMLMVMIVLINDAISSCVVQFLLDMNNMFIQFLKYEGTLTPWSIGLLEKLTVSQLVRKFPAFYGTRRFITAFTRACHLSLS
jgi:hypothetical protein